MIRRLLLIGLLTTVAFIAAAPTSNAAPPPTYGCYPDLSVPPGIICGVWYQDADRGVYCRAAPNSWQYPDADCLVVKWHLVCEVGHSPPCRIGWTG